MNLRHQSGITILELLIVVAVIGILTTVGVVMFKPNHAKLAAQEFQAMMRQARFEAVRLTRPVEVEWGVDANRKAFLNAYVLEPTTNAMFNINQRPVCGSDRVESDSSITDDFAIKQAFGNHGRDGIRFDPEGGNVYWLPNGIVFDCETNVQVTELSFLISDGSNETNLHFVGSYDVKVGSHQ